MIEISLGKLVLLALIALIVLGPEKLPGAARTAGALLRRVRSGWDNVRAEVERELEIEEIKRTAREAAAQAEAAQGQFKDGLKTVSDIPGSVVAAVTAPVESPAPDEPASTQAELPLNDPALNDPALSDPAPNGPAATPAGESHDRA